MNKKQQREAFTARLDTALGNLYHNATPNHPYGIWNAAAEAYDSWFEDTAMAEIDYIAGGGPYPHHETVSRP